MLTTLARLATTRPRAVLAAALLVMLACGAFGASAASHMKAGGFVTEDLESVRAGEFLSDHFPGGATNYILLITADEGGADSPAARAAGEKAIARLAEFEEVSGVQSYWTTRADLAPALRSKDGKSALVIGYIAGDDSELTERADRISREVQTSENGVTVRAGGLGAAFADMNTQISRDLIVAEAIAIPLTGLLLILVFGSVVAAAMPVAIGLFAVVAALGILRTLTVVTDVSIFALNMTTALGLALAIDYSLFIVSRYREELARGLDPAAAVTRSVQTAGRTVIYSALVVALSLATLAVFPQFFFKSFAYAGVAVVCAAAAAAVIVLPAMLMLLGDRVDAWDLRAGVRRVLGRPEPADVPADRSFWYRWVVAVMRRAIPIALLTTILLLLVGSPFLGARFGYPDDRALSAAPSREVGDQLRENFTADMATSVIITMPDFRGEAAEIGEYAAALSKIPDVPAVLSGAGVYLDGLKVAAPLPDMVSEAGAFVSVGTSVDPYSGAGKDQLARLREVPAPAETLFGGPAALNQDSLAAIGERLPMAAVLIAVTTLILLFLFTGSLLLPIKALTLNMLSLAATFGAMVWIFQEGHLSGPLGFTPTGNLDLSMPILMFSIAFGASMDYEVFLLSRIREEWLAGPKTAAGNTDAVAMGVARTGRIFTAAALLMSIVFIAVATSGVTAMKLFGIGCALAVLSDATVIRGLLAPALMRLLGTANWWAPKPLAALHARFGLHEAEEHPAADATSAERGAVALGK